MKKLLLPFIFLLFPFCINAQWHHTSGPPSGNGGSNVYSLLAHGNDLFAGTQEEIYVTHDIGSSWALDTTGFNIPANVTYGMSSLCAMGNTLVTLKGNHVYR